MFCYNSLCFGLDVGLLVDTFCNGSILELYMITQEP
jgi:hypothetical protein